LSDVTAIGHGRVNLIGEHTDYNLGLALPLTLPLRTVVTASLRPDWRIVVTSDAFHGDGPRAFEAGEWGREGLWTDYVRAASSLLAREGIFEHGATLAITSDIPPGAGLASSAALSVALVRALSALGGVTLEPRQAAIFARRIETDFVGAPVGLMDQLAAVGQPGRAQLIDFQDESVQSVEVPAALGIEIIDSGLRHEHRSGGYAERRAECARACEQFGIRSLRDLESAPPKAGVLSDVLMRRVRHVLGENQRVRDAVTALEQADFARFGALLSESHASLRDDFDVSLPAIDAIVDKAIQTPGVFGARLTGGGFGGCVIVAKDAGHLRLPHSARSAASSDTPAARREGR
jgi:galactokinase